MSFFDHVFDTGHGDQPEQATTPQPSTPTMPAAPVEPAEKWSLSTPEAVGNHPDQGLPVVKMPWWWSKSRKDEHLAQIMAEHQAELERERDLRDVSTRWSQSQLVQVQNIRGKNGKTTVSVLVAAAFANYGGITPVAVDLNPTGNLAVRIENGHIVYDIEQMAQVADVLIDPVTPVSQITAFTKHQPHSRFDAVLARPRPYRTLEDGTQEFDDPTMTMDETHNVLTALGRVYPVIIGDGSNNTADYPSRAVWGLAHCVVVPTTWRSDDAASAMETLKGLDETGRSTLANNAVIAHINTRVDDEIDQARHEAYTTRLQARGLTVVDIPYDPVIAQCEAIDWTQLQPETQRAALQLAAEVARRFTRWPQG